MRKHGRAMIEGAGLLLVGLLLFLFPEESVAAAREGISLCVDVLIPSLFPFFVLSSLLISTGLAGLCARPLESFMRPLFGVGGAGAAALSLGLIGGYPVGARTVAQLVQRRECSQTEARRLSLFCNNCGPAFFIGAAGVGVFGAKEAGFLLLGANLTAAVLLGILFHVFGKETAQEETRKRERPAHSPLTTEFPQCVRNAFSSTLGVCAYVILFSVLTRLADCSGLLPFLVNVLSSLLPGENAPVLCRSFCVGLMELSTGTAAIRDGVSSPLSLPLAAFILGWGGLSVHCQSLPFWREAGVPSGPYLRARFLHGLLSAGITALATLLFPLSLPAMAPVTPLAAPSLLGQEVLALWGMAGIYFFFFDQKRVEKSKSTRYNKRIP